MSLIKLKIKLADIQWPSPFNPFFFYQSGHLPGNASGTRNRGWVEMGEGRGGGERSD